MRKQENLIQGSPEWDQFRLEHNGASEAASMLGLSNILQRNELLKIKHTGITKEFSDYVQKFILDKGHKVEAMARPIVENIIDDQLYPVTYSLGKLSASCDGLTGMRDIAFEHKQWNQKLADAVKDGVLPEMHWPQCQQVLLVTGAEKLIFVVSDGTEENIVWMWVYPDAALHQVLVDGWAQFEKDLEDYVPTEIIEPPRAEIIKDFPAVSIQVKGELTTCNLDAVRPHFDKFLSNAITVMETDDDFAQAEAEAKLGRETAKRCKLTAKAVVDQMLSISEVTLTLEEYAAKFDALALKQEKAVKEQKENRKTTAKLERDMEYSKHIADLNAEIKPIVLVLTQADKPDFVSAMKNQRTLKSLYNNLDTELSRAKIAADSVAKDAMEKLSWFNESYGPGNGVRGFWHLFSDMQSIIFNNQIDSFKCVVESRISAEKKAEAEKLEEQRLKIKAEAEKLEEQRLKIKAEDDEKSVTTKQEEVNAEAVDITENKNITKDDDGIPLTTPPTREQLIIAVAIHFKVDLVDAENWIIEAFK